MPHPTIYWFKDKGLFTGLPQWLGLTSDTELEHASDVVIKDFEIVKNRYGGHCRITMEAISDLHILTIEGQYNFFKTIPVSKTR